MHIKRTEISEANRGKKLIYMPFRLKKCRFFSEILCVFDPKVYQDDALPKQIYHQKIALEKLHLLMYKPIE